MLILITGGERSGKRTFAQRLAQNLSDSLLDVAIGCAALFLGLCLFVVSLAAAAAPETASTTISLGFGSCIRYPESPIFHRIAEKNLDAFLFLGDNIYLPDTPEITAKDPRTLYRKLGQADGFRQLQAKTRLLATWDDHDFGPNNSDSLFKGRPLTLRAFRDFWRKNPPPVAGLEDGVAFAALLGPVQLLVPDGRSYRISASRDTKMENPGMQRAGILGERQLSWIEDALSKPERPVIVIGLSTQLLSTAFATPQKHVESFSQYPGEKDRLLRAIDRSPASVVILSGDRHFAEVLEQKLPSGKRLREFTASPIAAPTADPEFTGADPARRALYVGEENFGVLTVRLDGTKPMISAQFFGESGELLVQFPGS